MNWKHTYQGVTLAALFAIVGCSGADDDPSHFPGIDSDPQPTATLGQSRFYSADGRAGQATQDNQNDGNNANNLDATAEGGDRADDRTVEEGDIYRVTTTGHVLNLNAYRGLQIIDFSDATQPKIVGTVQVSGSPVEMYQVGNRVFMLLNNWQGYYGSRTDVIAETYNGGLVMVVDISNPALPKVTGRAQVPGWIRSSRLTRGNNQEALFVVSNDYGDTGQTTKVRSFSVSTLGKLEAKSEVDLGGYVQAIQATPDRLLVARHNWNRSSPGGSDVSVIDITSPQGVMVEGASVQVDGLVQNKFNMDVDGDILRVVSGNTWSTGSNTNHVETFNAADINALTPIDHKTFGDGENLFATLFLGQKAFFVTYRRVDPFHAFEVSPTGQLTEKSEFIVSGWNDYFKPVSQQSRLIGIGKNDEDGRNTMAVSLYDITDLSNPNPLLDRKEVDLDRSWSEANWDDRAFTVLEKGTRVVAPTGEIETGLVLLPYNGWDSANNTYVSAVQIFTFSDTTLTKRGAMDHDTQVRRSFVADRAANTTGNLSEMELSFFNTTNPDLPAHLGSVELAASYSAFLPFGNYGLRRHDQNGYYWWWRPSATTSPTDDLEIVSLSGDPDKDEALATISIPANAKIKKVGDLLVSMDTRQKNADNYDEFETEIQVWDLSMPTLPVLKSTKTYDSLPLAGNYYGYWGDDCFNCYRGYYYGSNETQAVGDALVFPERHYEQELEGTIVQTNVYAENNNQYSECYDQMAGTPKACRFNTGSINCRQLTRVDGTVEAKVCTGALQACSQDSEGERDCEPINADQIRTQTNTYTHEQYRHWNWMTFHVVDVSKPQLGEPTVISMSSAEEAVSVLPEGDSLFVSYRKPVQVPGDTRPYVAYYMQEIDLNDASSPVVGTSINVPGELLDVDGSTVITRDYLWGANVIETAIAKLQIQNDLAFVRGIRRFADEQVEQVLLDGNGKALVTHRTPWLINHEEHGYYDYEDWDRTLRLSILDVQSRGLTELSVSDVDDWARLQGAMPGRALFTVPGGLLILKVDDAAEPTAHSYYPMRGWPQSLEIVGRDIYMAAGPFGLYKMSADGPSNLLTP